MHQCDFYCTKSKRHPVYWLVWFYYKRWYTVRWYDDIASGKEKYSFCFEAYCDNWLGTDWFLFHDIQSVCDKLISILRHESCHWIYSLPFTTLKFEPKKLESYLQVNGWHNIVVDWLLVLGINNHHIIFTARDRLILRHNNRHDSGWLLAHNESTGSLLLTP